MANDEKEKTRTKPTYEIETDVPMPEPRVLKLRHPNPDATAGHAPHKETECDVWLSEVGPPEDIDWLVRDRFPLGKLMGIDGDPRIGKSSICDYIMACVTRGNGLPDEEDCEPECQVGKVLYVSTEEELKTVFLPKMMALGADITKVALKEWEMPAQLEDLRQFLTRNMETKLAVIDPIEARKYNHRVMSQLSQLAREHHVCIVLVRHLLKHKGIDPLRQGLGRMGIGGHYRISFIVQKNPLGDDRYFSVLKDQIAAPMTWKFDLRPHEIKVVDKRGQRKLKKYWAYHHLGPDPRDAWKLSKQFRAAEKAIVTHDASAVAKCKQVMLATIEHEGSVWSEDLRKALYGEGFSKATVDRAQSELVKEGLKPDVDRDLVRIETYKDRQSKKWYWRLARME